MGLRRPPGAEERQRYKGSTDSAQSLHGRGALPGRSAFGDGLGPTPPTRNPAIDQPTECRSTITAIYKERWQIELFFKALKQSLKIKTFVGTSANAVRTQIWTALITILLIKILQFKSTFGWALSN